MTRKRITDLTAITGANVLATDDVVPIVDVSEVGVADRNKKIKVSELVANTPSFTPLGSGASQRALQTKIREMEVTPQDYTAFSLSDANAGFQAAIAAIKANGGGRLKVPRATYVFDVDAEADTLLIDFDNFQMECEPGTIFQWDYYGLPLIAVVGADYVDIGNIHFVWTGTRGGAPASNNHYGYDGGSVLSSAEWASHICVGGSNYVRLHHISWAGSTTAKNLENGIAIWSGTATAASGAADVVGNVIEDITVNDTVFGVVGHGQDHFTIRNIHGDRFLSAAGHVGPGHLLYLSNVCTNGNVENIVDEGTAIDTIAATAAVTAQFKGLQSCTVRNLKSKRIPGLVAITCTSSADCTGNVFEDFAWEADRVSDQANLASIAVAVIAQTNTTKVMSRNVFRNWHLHDKKNSGSSDSANCPILGQGGNTYRANNATDNVFENINISHAPDGSHSAGICSLFGQQSLFDIGYNNYGSAVKAHFQLVQDDAARPSDDNNITLRIGGLTVAPNFDVAGTENYVSVHTRSSTANAGTVAAGNAVVPDYGTWTPTITFATVGDLSVTYSQQVGRWTKIAPNLVVLKCHLLTSAFTHTTASGALRIVTPFTALNVSNFTQAGGGGIWRGITKANYTDITPFMAANEANVQLAASGSGQAIGTIAAADMPTGGTVQLDFTMIIQI